MGALVQKIAITATCHRVRVAHQAAYAQAQRVRAPAPVEQDPILAEQCGADLALAGASGERVMDAQHCQPALHAWIAREQRAGEAAVAVNRRPKRTPYRRPKGTPFVERCDGYGGRAVRAGCGVGRA